MKKKKIAIKNIEQVSLFFKTFVRSQQFGGLLLVACAAFSLVVSNSAFAHDYLSIWHHQISIGVSNFSTAKSIEFIVNDGLMTIFFLLVGLEIKRELLQGELSTTKKAALPFAAALGGMIVPALIYFCFNINTVARNGWGIPMATDIAFALGILALLGSRVPNSLKIFLTALAVIDDLGAIIVIGIFYNSGLNFMFLSAAIFILIILFLLNKFKINSLLIYILFGVILWYCVYKSGIHATLSGVLFAFTIPAFEKDGKHSMLHRMEHFLHKPVNFFIMPLFALANTCIVLSSDGMQGVPSSLMIGIIAGLLIGKPVGIILVSWMATKLKLGVLPNNISWKQFAGIGMLGGIGFTMSIFIALLAFNVYEMITVAKISIVIASLASGILGYFWLRFTLPKKNLSADE